MLAVWLGVVGGAGINEICYFSKRFVFMEIGLYEQVKSALPRLKQPNFRENQEASTYLSTGADFSSLAVLSASSTESTMIV